MGKILKNYVYNGLYQLFVMLVPLITAPYLARTLGAGNIGVYGYVNSASNLIVNLGLLGLYDYGNRQIAYYRDEKSKASQTFWEIMTMRLLLSFAIVLAYICFATITDYTIYFLLYIPWVLANCFDCSWLFVGMEDMGATCAKNFFAKLAGVICIFVFVKGPDDLWIYIVSLSLSVLIANLIVYLQLGKYIEKFQIEPQNFKGHIKGSIQFFLPQMAMLAYTQIDKVMIASFLQDTTFVAFYDQAEKIVQIPMSLVTVISTVMMPRIANEFKKGNSESVNNYIVMSGSFMLMLAFPLAFGISSIAPDFIPWYLGAEFIPTIVAIISLSPIIIANALSGLCGKQYLTATNQMGYLFNSYIITAVINIALNSVLIPSVGWLGAVVATDVSAITCAAIQIKRVKKQVNGFKTLFKNSVYFICASVAMTFICILVGRNISTSIITTVIQTVVGMISYFGVLFLLRNEALLFGIDVIKKLRGKRKYE